MRFAEQHKRQRLEVVQADRFSLGQWVLFGGYEQQFFIKEFFDLQVPRFDWERCDHYID